MWELHGDDATGLSAIFSPPTNRLCPERVPARCFRAGGPRCRPSAASSRAVSRPKNFTQVSIPFATRDFRAVCGGLDAEDRDSGRLEILQQVAIVAGYFDDQGLGPRPSDAPSARSTPSSGRARNPSTTKNRRNRRRRSGRAFRLAAIAPASRLRRPSGTTGKTSRRGRGLRRSRSRSKAGTSRGRRTRAAILPRMNGTGPRSCRPHGGVVLYLRLAQVSGSVAAATSRYQPMVHSRAV